MKGIQSISDWTSNNIKRSISTVWIGSGGPDILPARSPDQSYLNFFLLGYGKAKACEISIHSNVYLVFPISVDAGEVRYTLGIFQKLRNNKQRRRHTYIRAHGKTFEHILLACTCCCAYPD
ncbi:hypothetical protein AVEN_148791-1 [Araneus ventricosus]|uniref:Uncharacterized protein n=1 Tax=Araneus ventricosus TaxID=182803 RepID=A0A4Y2U8K6_ARAVE|nr:hypothetical protein AVEN_148791-1 [Araneus ventricosus]